MGQSRAVLSRLNLQKVFAQTQGLLGLDYVAQRERGPPAGQGPCLFLILLSFFEIADCVISPRPQGIPAWCVFVFSQRLGSPEGFQTPQRNVCNSEIYRGG